MTDALVFLLGQTEVFFEVSEVTAAARGAVFAHFTDEAVAKLCVTMRSASRFVAFMKELVRSNLLLNVLNSVLNVIHVLDR